MKIVVLSNEDAKNELLTQCQNDSILVIHITEVAEFSNHTEADAFFDLQFEMNAERVELLKKFSAKPIFINAVPFTILETDTSFIRVNGWSTFLKNELVEAACLNEFLKTAAEKIITALHKTIEWVPDVKGFISARVVSMIINEAYFALEEKVSTKREIDTAMKLGTNYPYGPFEWGELIGLKNIYELLNELSKTESRYTPAALLKKEISL